jgi:type II secretory ATPase GspE/PulE/Tfp pilus assembly ATPase PilB-like protein
MGIHEMLEGTKDVKLLIKKASPTEQIFERGAEQGMTTLLQDGILKVFAGLTDVNEVRRVCVS